MMFKWDFQSNRTELDFRIGLLAGPSDVLLNNYCLNNRFLELMCYVEPRRSELGFSGFALLRCGSLT